LQGNKKIILIRGMNTKWENKTKGGNAEIVKNDLPNHIYIEYYINSENYAIEKAKSYFKTNYVKLGYDYWFYNEVDFHEIEGKYYPAFFKTWTTGGMEHSLYKGNSEEKNIQAHSFYFMTNEWTEKVRPIKRKGKPYKSTPYDYLIDLKFPYNKDFWKNYNMIEFGKNDSLDYSILLEKSSLEEQFMKNGK
jgi:hypothetical protein